MGQVKERRNIGVIGLKGLPAFGGAATVGENIIHELKNEYHFTVYAISSHASDYEEYKGYTQIVFRRFFFRGLNIFYYYLRSALHCIFATKYDLIHLHHIDGAFILPLLRLKYKVLCTAHAQPQISDKWPWFVKLFLRLNENIALKLANTMTVVSMPLKEIYTAKSSRQIYYIPNGISLTQRIASDEISQAPYILFAAGRILQLKGLHILLKALKLAKIEQQLVVIGDLNQVPSYKEEILKLSEGMEVKFIPLIREKEKLLNYVLHARLFVFPSLSENMSMMLLEAAFTKVPLICSDIQANTAIFDESEVLFFKTNNDQDLSEKIPFALTHPDIMHEKSEAAFRKLVSTYNWEKISRQYAGLYDELSEN
jgi:glycosyltransferase involved in cell wall biosynthesis